MDLLDPARIVVGRVLLVAGAMLLVEGASALALRLGVPPIVTCLIGLVLGASWLIEGATGIAPYLRPAHGRGDPRANRETVHRARGVIDPVRTP